MSLSFFYREVQPLPKGKSIDLSLARALHDAVEADWSKPFQIVKNDRIHWFIKGLSQAGWADASELDDAITQLGQIELQLHTDPGVAGA